MTVKREGWGTITEAPGRQRRTLHFLRTANVALCGLRVLQWAAALTEHGSVEAAFCCGNCARIRRAELEWSRPKETE